MFYVAPQTICESKVFLNLLKEFLHLSWLVALFVLFGFFLVK